MIPARFRRRNRQVNRRRKPRCSGRRPAIESLEPRCLHIEFLEDRRLLAPVAPLGSAIGLNFEGQNHGNSGQIPPDTMGTVGRDHVVQIINGAYAVYNKLDGSLLRARSLTDFWEQEATGIGAGNAGGPFDPRIQYDPIEDRFYAVSVNHGHADNEFLLAVSDDGNPLNGWTAWAVDTDSNSGQRWADFPLMSFDADGVYITVNMIDIPGDATNYPGENSTLVLPKADLLANPPSIANRTLLEDHQATTGWSSQGIISPSNTDGLPTYFLTDGGGGGGAGNTLRFTELRGPVTSPSYHALNDLPVQAADAAPLADQPNDAGLSKIETGPRRFNSAIWHHNGSYWGAHGVEDPASGNAAIRFVRIDAEFGSVAEDLFITDANLDLYYPSIAVSGPSNGETVVIGFTASGANKFPSAYAVIGKTDGTETTTFSSPFQLHEGTATYENLDGARNRWGDYSATVVDPVDPNVFWTFQEWADGTNPVPFAPSLAWSTQITQIIASGTPGNDVYLELNPFGDAAVAGNLAGEGEGTTFVFAMDTNGETRIRVTEDALGLDTGLRLWDLDEDVLVDVNLDNFGDDPQITRDLPFWRLYSAEAFSQTGSGDYTFTFDGPDMPLTPIGLDEFGRGRTDAAINNMLDSDYYELVAPTNATGDLEVRLIKDASLDGVVTLYDASGTYLWAAGGSQPGGVSTIEFSDINAGETYYLRVGSFQYKSQGGFTLDVDFSTPLPPTMTDAEGFAYFHHDGASHDTQTLRLSTGGADIDTPGDVDSFYFSGDTFWSGTYTIRANALSGNVDPLLAVYDTQNGTLVGLDNDSGSGQNARLDVTLLETNRYIVAVADHMGTGTGDVELLITAPDSTPPIDIPIALDGSGSHSGDSLGVFDSDFFRFTAPATANGTIEVRVTPDASLDVAAVLMDAAGNEIAKSYQFIAGNAERIAVTGLTPSTDYHLTVFAVDYATEGGYEIDVQFFVDPADFGDAPTPYPTLAANNGVVHKLVTPSPVLGSHVDADSDGQPDPLAQGDDLNGTPDDEDGVEFLDPLLPGETARIRVSNSGALHGRLSGWIDFDGNGSFADAGEQVLSDASVSAGETGRVFFLDVPANAALGYTFARFRISIQEGLSFDGPAVDGEVEDYRVAVEPLDFGDAPPTYPTLRLQNGPRHALVDGPTLGFRVDAERDGQPGNFDALGDDVNGTPDDEDGVVFQTPLSAGDPASIELTNGSGTGGYAQAWIDFNYNGSWADPGEQIVTNLWVPASSTATVNFTVPASAGMSYAGARFRISTEMDLSFEGLAFDGEVEDYRVNVAGPILVTNTRDDGLPGSLRWAINEANKDPGENPIFFQIADDGSNAFEDVDSHLTHPLADANPDAFVIRPQSPLPELNDQDGGTLIDGRTQTWFGGDSNPFGPEIVLDGSQAGPDADGLHILSSHNQVLSLNIQNFGGNGVLINGGNLNLLAGNYIGVDATGTIDFGNGAAGVFLLDANDNTIGGTTLAERNVVSSNADGVWITTSNGTAGTGNVVRGNYVGLSALGNAPLGNDFAGVRVNSDGNIVQDNYVAANFTGIAVGGSNNVVQSNLVGLAVDGVSPLGGNGAGVFVEGNDNLIGGGSGAGNAISSYLYGVEINGNAGRGYSNRVQGNRIGTDEGGTLDRGNDSHGVYLRYGASHNIIGADGDDEGKGNLISGNDGSGVYMDGIGTGHNVVAGNLVGTDVSGTVGVGNRMAGVNIREGAANNVVGGLTPAARNVISGNQDDGVLIAELSRDNRVLGNLIGTDAGGTADLGNRRVGVHVTAGSSNNTIGGPTPAARNVISGNDQYGVAIRFYSTDNVVSGNYIGLDVQGSPELGNVLSGVWIATGSSDNIIGGSIADARNVISASGHYGVLIEDAGTAGNMIAGNRIFGNDLAGVAVVGDGAIGNAIRRNSIHSNGGLGIDLGADGVTENDKGKGRTSDDGDSGPNQLQNFPEVDKAWAGATTRILGELRSVPNTTFLVDVYANPPEALGLREGRRHLGSFEVTSDRKGRVRFDTARAPLAPLAGTAVGELITATATDPAGNTSEFSAPAPAVEPDEPTVAGADAIFAGFASPGTSASYPDPLDPNTVDSVLRTGGNRDFVDVDTQDDSRQPMYALARFLDVEILAKGRSQAQGSENEDLQEKRVMALLALAEELR
jgi:hypothetical protein